MLNFGYITKKAIAEHSPNWPEIDDHPYKRLTVEGFGSKQQMHCLI